MSFSPAFAPERALSSTEGALVSIAIRVDPQGLEDLLEALAGVDFPINPQIYHEAEVVFFDLDGHEHAALTTLVEFPAYLGRLDEVYQALGSHGFDRQAMIVTSMLAELRSHGLVAAREGVPGWAVRSRHGAG